MSNNFTPENCKGFIQKSVLSLAISLLSFFTEAQQPANGYNKASYTPAQSGKFMKTWLIAGPFQVSNDPGRPGDAAQQELFKKDIITNVSVVSTKPVIPVSASSKNFKWQLLTSREDAVNLDEFYQKKDFAYAYALTEIKTDAPRKVVLAVGSDDGIKIWLNGKLVHDKWIGRGVVKDDDLVPLQLEKGSNQLLLKVQDMEGGWGFVARLLDKQSLTEQLNTAVGNGNLDKIKMLTEGGADINAANEKGISPIAAAKISGRDDVVKMLLTGGAKDQPVPSAESIVDNYYTSFKEKPRPGIAILVAKDGKVVYRKGFGYADVKNNIPVTPDTKFRIGSVTKQFTAAAILKLQENNLLNVNDKLSKYIPDFPRGEEVTIYQLVTHISGIHSYTSNPTFLDKVTTTISPDSLVNAIKKDPYDFNPGEKMLYNNSGYFILGYIISKVSGKPYATYLKETFFDPLDMNNTGVHYAGIKLEHEAKGYSKKDDGYDESLNWDMSWAGGAGAIYSIVDDLLKWNEALHAGKVLSEKSMKEALTPAVLKNGDAPAMKYGYGLGFDSFRGEDIVGHSGGLHGFITQLSYYPKEKLTVVMFSNTDQPDVNFDNKKIAEAFLWDKLDKQVSYVEATEKPKDLQSLTGRYEIMFAGVLTVSTEDDKLYAQLSGQQKFQIFPLSDTEFFWKIVDAKVKFIKDEKGQAKQAIIYQNGQELKGDRLKDGVIVTVNPDVLDKYVGKYKLNNTLIVTVSKENNKLFALPTDQPKVELLPTSETDFVIPEINAKVSFIKDENGKVNKFKLVMNGVNSEAPRIE